MIKFLTFLFFLNCLFTSENTEWPGYFGNNDRVASKLNCPGNIGCECSDNSDCLNINCKKHLRGNYCSLKEGDIFPEFNADDQFGQIISISDFSKKGKYIMLEMGASWCGPCRELADWFSYNISDIQSKSFWKPEYNEIYNLVHNDKIYFI